MTDIEKAVAYALRLSDAAATKLLTEIQRNISLARAELIRSGVIEDIANSTTNVLVQDAIIAMCLARMDDEGQALRHEERFKYCQDNLRKSYHEE